MFLLFSLFFATATISPIQEVESEQEENQVVVLEADEVLEDLILSDDEIANSAEVESLLEEEEVLAN